MNGISIVCSYIFPNTFCTKRVCRMVVKNKISRKLSESSRLAGLMTNTEYIHFITRFIVHQHLKGVKFMESQQSVNPENTGILNMVAQPEHFGIDYYGNEILAGDSIVIDPSNGEIILEDSLEDYLIEVRNFQFQTAK